MSKMSLKIGRVNQKLQTRKEILTAAKQLMHKSKKISLEDVAHKAKVSRATIYRYFPNVELLYTEATLDVYHHSLDNLEEATKAMSMHDRIIYLQTHYNQQALSHELVFRRYLSAVLTASITSKKKFRGARRVDALQRILEPFKKEMPKKDFNNLINISTILMGIDAVITSKDVCGLDNQEISRTLQWGIEMVLKGIEYELQTG